MILFKIVYYTDKYYILYNRFYVLYIILHFRLSTKYLVNKYFVWFFIPRNFVRSILLFEKK